MQMMKTHMILNAEAAFGSPAAPHSIGVDTVHTRHLGRRFYVVNATEPQNDSGGEHAWITHNAAILGTGEEGGRG
jgi:hypothetical protein